MEIEAEFRHPLAAIASLISPDADVRAKVLQTLPEPIKTLEAGEVLELVLALARLTDPSIPGQFPAKIDPDLQKRQVQALAKAWEMIQGLPYSVYDLLACWKNEASETKKRFIHVSPILNCEFYNENLPGTRQILGTVLAGMTSDNDDIPESNIAVREAGKLLQCREELFVEARRQKVLLTRVSMKKGRVLPNLDRAEVEILAGQVKDRTTLHKAATKLYLPTYAINQLVDGKVLTACTHPWFDYRYGETVVTNSAVSDFEERLRLAAVLALGSNSTITLDRAMTGFGGGPKPWAKVFQLLLDQTISFQLTGPMTTRNILIRKSDASQIWHLQKAVPVESYSQEDALEILNLPPKAGKHLLTVGESWGGGQIGKVWSVPGNILNELAARYISYGEIMARTGLSPKGIESVLRAGGLTAPSGLGWSREEVGAKGWILLS